ncbi:hypothetical protein FN846DRAFT_779235 [Sphaerosporella brunnea]|uniref:Cryptic loci regulator 2 N-terminal domain-containing protein n=1 Tax=Sphaerosporella brunnea TaxID=1250544 RepID=A0A5J5EW21_9PEZI|nr:hypothetical protein FN846DRAFT_779235 [Sphaerosporella brunnea]
MPRKKSTVAYTSSQTTKRSAGEISNIARDERFRFVLLHNSDGTEIWHDGVNGPTPDMLDPSPDENGAQCYMRLVGDKEKKYWDWLKQLAEAVVLASDDDALKRDIQEGVKIVFQGFPAGYRLYEQIRGPGGGKPRRDTYLYGHPKGPRKRFRSPMDFAPHVKWLSCDPTKNPANCACNACKGGPPPAPSPPAVPATTRIVPAGVPTATGPTTPLPMPTVRKQEVPATRRQTPVIPQTPVPAPVPSYSPVHMMDAVLSATNLERERDLRFPGLSIYRLGEQVWFQTGPHWAIGVVIEIPTSPTASYKIHPLHSPLICEQTQPHTDILAINLRPWVAWSTPPVTNRNLDADKIDYENLPWLQEKGSGSIEVDASILKSRDVDVSFTLIDKLTLQNHYAGVYHGAERIWVGDAVRLKATSCPAFNTGREIMVVHSIQDFTTGNQFATRIPDTKVTITGAVFRLVNQAHAIPSPAGLPTAVQADLTARMRFATPNPDAPYWNYIMVARSATIKLEDIKSRWYPGSSLYRIMHGLERFKQLAESRQIAHLAWDEVGSKMNEMGTAGNGAVLGYRRYEQRHQAFSKAIPSNIVFPLSLNSAGSGHHTIESSLPPTLGLHQASAEVPMASIPDSINAHGTTLNAVPEPIDLTGDDNNEGMEFLADHDHDSVDDEFMKQIGEDAASFLHNDDDFYGGL